MTEARKRSLQAISLFIGSILGAGVFGLPYAFSKAGFAVGFLYLVVLTGVILLLQLLSAEITIQTPGRKRLTALAGEYLGSYGRWITTLLFFGLTWGVLISYIILGGSFLTTLLQPVFGGSFFVYGLIFIIVEAALVALPLRKAARFQLLVGGTLLILFSVLILSGLPQVDIGNLFTITTEHKFLPYGVVLFSLAGLGVMPEMHDIFGKKYEYRLSKAVIHGYMILFVLYLLFALAVVGVTGAGTTEDAFIGYATTLGPFVGTLGSLVGLVTIGSIFMMMGEQMKDTFLFDFSLGKFPSWFLTLIVPVALFLFGVRDFITVISFTGAVFSALLACMILLIYERMRKTRSHKTKHFAVPRVLSIIIGIIFIVGALRQILLTFFL
ncbi:MAG: hypothetical protein O2877_01475 [bacterium]|nr:hypothetical protein [bacterium]